MFLTNSFKYKVLYYNIINNKYILIIINVMVPDVGGSNPLSHPIKFRFQKSVVTITIG